MNHKLLFIVSAIIALQACTVLTYRDGTSEFTRFSFGTNLQITDLSATTAPNGDRTITLQGYTSDQVESLKAVAEGVAKGLGAAK